MLEELFLEVTVGLRRGALVEEAAELNPDSENEGAMRFPLLLEPWLYHQAFLWIHAPPQHPQDK